MRRSLVIPILVDMATWRRVDFCVFHAPYNKLVRKAHARWRCEIRMIGRRNWCVPGDVAYEQSLVDKGLDASLRKASADDYDKRVAPSTEAPRHIGNCYTASVFFGLVSLVASTDLEGKRVLMFSYGSGAVASMYVLKGRFGKIALSNTVHGRSVSEAVVASSGPRRTSRRRATRARLPTGRRRSSRAACAARGGRVLFAGRRWAKHRREYGLRALVCLIEHHFHCGGARL